MKFKYVTKKLTDAGETGRGVGLFRVDDNGYIIRRVAKYPFYNDYHKIPEKLDDWIPILADEILLHDRLNEKSRIDELDHKMMAARSKTEKIGSKGNWEFWWYDELRGEKPENGRCYEAGFVIFHNYKDGQQSVLRVIPIEYTRY